MSISVTPAPAINPSVLMDILGANETVQARVKGFEAARAAAEEALANLKLGQDAKAAHANADARLKAAAQALEEAQKNAGATLADANANASAVMTAAQDQAARVLADIEQRRTAHDRLVSSTQADLKNKQDALAGERAAFDRVIAEHRQMVETAARTQAAAELAMKKAAEAEVTFKTRAAALQQTLASLTK
jgi:hypothetical protein